MSDFEKYYILVRDTFKDWKEKCIINEVINQSIFQGTEEPLIEQTYLALLCGCSRMTIHRVLKRLKQDEWITYKMVLNKKGYTTTKFIMTEKLKALVNKIERKKTTKKMKEKVVNSIIPKIDDSPLSMERCNF